MPLPATVRADRVVGFFCHDLPALALGKVVAVLCLAAHSSRIPLRIKGNACIDDGPPPRLAVVIHAVTLTAGHRLVRNPAGYCNHGPNGLTCPIGVAELPAQTDIEPPRERG